MIKTLVIDTTLKIPEGQRHTTLMSVADSLLFNHLGRRNSKINTEKQLKKFFEQINYLLCEPEPLPDSEFSNIWNSALGFVSRTREQ